MGRFLCEENLVIVTIFVDFVFFLHVNILNLCKLFPKGISMVGIIIALAALHFRIIQHRGRGLDLIQVPIPCHPQKTTVL